MEGEVIFHVRKKDVWSYMRWMRQNRHSTFWA